jgi:hypothetical protein
MLNTKYEILNQNQRAKVKMQNDRAKFKNQLSEAFLHFDLNCQIPLTGALNSLF